MKPKPYMSALRVSGFNSKLVKMPLLYELFTQGGPVKKVVMMVRGPEPHAIVHFHHEESVPYCLALFNGLQMHGELLRLNPLRYNKNTNSYLNYMNEVRRKLRDEFASITPPELPPKLPPKIAKNDTNTQQSERRRKKPKKKRGANKVKKDTSNADIPKFTKRRRPKKPYTRRR